MSIPNWNSEFQLGILYTGLYNCPLEGISQDSELGFHKPTFSIHTSAFSRRRWPYRMVWPLDASNHDEPYQNRNSTNLQGASSPGVREPLASIGGRDKQTLRFFWGGTWPFCLPLEYPKVRCVVCESLNVWIMMIVMKLIIIIQTLSRFQNYWGDGAEHSGSSLSP